MATTERKVSEMTDDEINAELDDLLGVNRTAKTAGDAYQAINETSQTLRRIRAEACAGVKHPYDDIWDITDFWDRRFGRDYQEAVESEVAAWRKSPTPYCSSWEHAMALGEEMTKRGFHLQYAFWLRRIVFGQQWVCDQSEFETAHATPRQRAEAALMVLREAQSNADSSQ